MVLGWVIYTFANTLNLTVRIPDYDQDQYLISHD